MWRKALLLLAVVALVAGDMYMQNPRGSNDRLDETSTNRQNANRLFDSQNNAKGGYAIGPYLYYYVNSLLEIEWTNQHGCGGNDNLNCEVVIQYMCGDDVRDGATTNTIPDDETQSQATVPNPDPRFYRSNTDDNVVYLYGMHESYQYYQDCKSRARNGGLFIADRNVGGSARSTRQNNGGTRRGFECPEERDYYPYWHPSPWIDIAVLADSESRCGYYRSESQNRDGKNYCSNNVINNEVECIRDGSEWLEADSHGGRGVDCERGPFARDNHLGNGVGGKNNRYLWRIPDDPHEHCVLRLRYNISTNDYDGWGTYAEDNGNYVTQDPYVQFGETEDGVEVNYTLAIDTSQFGRTFQDRSHTFEIRSRSGNTLHDRIYNVNVRGKRGNIVQTYPATEYDFVPAFITTVAGDFVHYQWTGSDFNPTGNDGEGRAGTDRSNLVQIDDLGDNHPTEFSGSMFSDSSALEFAATNVSTATCLTYAELLAKHGNNAGAIAQDLQNCMVLNAAEPYFDGGAREFGATGKFNYMCTRNNNFSNRSQKGSLTVDPWLEVWAVVLVVISAAVCLSAIVVSIVGFVARLLPSDNPMSQGWRKINFLKDATEDADVGAADD